MTLAIADFCVYMWKGRRNEYIGKEPRGIHEHYCAMSASILPIDLEFLSCNFVQEKSIGIFNAYFFFQCWGSSPGP
jgi:hypothetical protein